MNRIRLYLVATVLLSSSAIAATRSDDDDAPDFKLPREPAAIRFDGDESRVVVPHSEALSLDGAMTVELWVRPKKSVVKQPWHPNLIGKRKENKTYPTWVLGLGADLQPYTVANDQWHYDERQLKRGEWAHVAMVFDGANVRFFIDGVPGKPHPAEALGPQNDEPVILGTLLNDTQQFAGDIASVRVSSSARYEGRFQPATSWRPDASTSLLMDFTRGKNLSHDCSGHATRGEVEGGVERVDLSVGERLEFGESDDRLEEQEEKPGELEISPRAVPVPRVGD